MAARRDTPRMAQHGQAMRAWYGPYPMRSRILRHQLAARRVAARRHPRQVRRLGHDDARLRQPDLRRAGRAAGRHQDLHDQHADVHGQPCRGRVPGRSGFRFMVSADPAWGKGGYPLLLQTGETADGQTPLIDRQHPHDLFMELAATYSHRLSESSSAVRLCRPARRAGARPAGLHASLLRRGQSRRRRSRTTGSIRRTSRMAW